MRMMIKIELALIFAALALLIVTVTPALGASPSWELCSSTANNGGYENNLCTKGKEKGEFEWSGVSETEEVTSSSSALEFADTKATGGEVSVKCAESSRGWIGSGGTDHISSLNLTNCKFVKHGLCEEAKGVSVKTAKLPWSSDLSEEAVGFRDKQGPIDLVFECAVGGIFKAADECEGTTSAQITNNEALSVVEAEFESKSEKTKCTVGGASAGEAKGVITLKGSKGGIKAEPARPTWFYNNGTQLVQLIGPETTSVRSVVAKKLVFKNPKITVECEKSTESGGRMATTTFELGNITLTNCAVTNPANCKVLGKQIALNIQKGQPRWKKDEGEEALLWFFNLGGALNGILTEFILENEGGACSTAGTYRVKGGFLAELKNPTAEEAQKKYSLTTGTTLFLGGGIRFQRMINKVQIGIEGALETGELGGEMEFAFNGGLAGKKLRIKEA